MSMSTRASVCVDMLICSHVCGYNGSVENGTSGGMVGIYAYIPTRNRVQPHMGMLCTKHTIPAAARSEYIGIPRTGPLAWLVSRRVGTINDKHPLSLFLPRTTSYPVNPYRV